MIIVCFSSNEIAMPVGGCAINFLLVVYLIHWLVDVLFI